MPPSPAPLALLLPSPQHLRAPDLAIIAAYLVGITLFGLHFRNHRSNSDRSLRSYFLAGNTVPWWAIALSVVSAETSTLTIISIPGVAFSGNFGFLQVVLGYLVGRVVVAALFLPRYFAGEMLTAYQLIDRRFGPLLHKVTAGLFLLTRAAAEGVRVFAVSIVITVAIGTGDVLSIAIISALTLLYTFEGGLAAVIWTDVVQMGIYVAGTIVALFSLGHHVPGGWTAIAHTAHAAGKFHTLTFALNLTQSYTFWAGLLGGTFLTMASHGTDQLMVQRLLAARNLRESQLALLSSGVVIFFQFAFFLLIGAGLWLFYGGPGAPAASPGHLAAGTSPDRLFPTFITQEMPTAVAGLLVAAILAAAMSNLSAALNSLSSTTVVDFYVRARPSASDRERTLTAKSSTVLWALVLFAIALLSLRNGGKGHVVEIGLSIAAVAYGCLLGVFLLGTLTRTATEHGTALGMLCGFALNLWLWLGSFPMRLGPFIVPHVAFTWYVLIGAAVTFAIGYLASLLPRLRRRAIPATAAVLLVGGLMSTMLHAQTTPPPAETPRQTKQRTNPRTPNPAQLPAKPLKVKPEPAADFAQVSQLIQAAIDHHQIPGAVVVIGHGGDVVFQHAYGDRKLAGEPGLDGKPSSAEAMTEDTVFDMASLTKVIVTTTAIGQLFEQGKLDFDAPLEQYLPDFNPTHEPVRSKVTLRLLLTHFSGEPPDVDLKDPWGLAAPDKAEGIHRALTTPLASPPGSKMVYSDINFILLGHLVEVLSGQDLDVYAQTHIFHPLGMEHSAYHSIEHACPISFVEIGSATYPNQNHGEVSADGAALPPRCANSLWKTGDYYHTAPTAHDDEGTPATNPDFNYLLRGTVHDPTARRMGGVAGHAGVFSTAHNMSLFAQALLDRWFGRPSKFPLKRKTLIEMTVPQQPGHTPFQVGEHFRANARALAEGQKPASGDPNLLDPNFPAIKDQPLRGFGWDIDSAFSKPRGRVFPIGSFGHTGFTGTSLWLDPQSDTFVLLLTNAIHPHPGPAISNLRGEVASAAATALGLYGTTPCPASTLCDPAVTTSKIAPEPTDRPFTAPIAATQSSSRPQRSEAERPAVHLTPAAFHARQPNTSSTLPVPSSIHFTESSSRLQRSEVERPAVHLTPAVFHAPQQITPSPPDEFPTPPTTQTGIDVLQATHFAALSPLARPNQALRLGLLTNQTGLDSHGRRTIDILFSALSKALPQARLTTLFSPEHGIFGQQDTEHLNAETDPATGLHVTSLYGAHDSDRRPSHDQLKDLDAVIIDLQDAGVRCFTYETVVGYFLEAASAERKLHNHNLTVVVLDRPDPLGGIAITGPTADVDATSYISYMPLPLQHGMTLGELARYINRTKALDANLTVVPIEHWTRDELFDQTGLSWTPPSPNLHTLNANLLYPATAMLELTNLSVGRGNALAFEVFAAVPSPGGSPWFQADLVAAALNKRQIPGVHFEVISLPIAETSARYPGHGQTLAAVHITVDPADRTTFNASELGVELLGTLHSLYPTQFHLDRAARLVANRETMRALEKNQDPRTIAAAWQPDLAKFAADRKASLLY